MPASAATAVEAHMHHGVPDECSLRQRVRCGSFSLAINDPPKAQLQTPPRHILPGHQGMYIGD